MKDLELAQVNRKLQDKSPEEILRWVFERWGSKQVIATSSFQNHSVPFLHLLSQREPSLRICFLQTGFHFPETLAFRDEVAQQLGLNIVNLKPEQFPPEELHKTDTDACCALNKVQALDKLLSRTAVWLTGIRRDQTAQRSNTEVVSRHRTGALKVCPLLNWDEFDIEVYLDKHPEFPKHPLLAQGYASVGCEPCTSKSNGRDGRWRGQIKTECGLHNDRRIS